MVEKALFQTCRTAEGVRAERGKKIESNKLHGRPIVCTLCSRFPCICM